MKVAYDLLDDLALIGATLQPAGDRLILRAGATAIPAALVHRAREAKADLIATLAADEARGACIVKWLNQHPASSAPGRCAWCGRCVAFRAILTGWFMQMGFQRYFAYASIICRR